MAGKNSFIKFLKSNNRSFKEIKSFLEQDPSSINELDGVQRNSLFYVISRDVVRLLLQYGASIDSRDKLGFTPLIYALKLPRDEDVIKELIEKGADVNVHDKMGHSVLCIALCKIPTKEIIESLLKAGCYIQSCTRHETAWHCFFKFCPIGLQPDSSEDVVKLLIAAGADVTKVDKSGRSPLCFALLSGAGLDCIKLLLSKGASFRDCKKHDSPMFCVTDSDSNKVLNADVVELLLNKKFSTKVVNEDECMPLQLVLRNCRYETAALRILLDCVGMQDISNIKHDIFGNLLHWAVANPYCRYSIVKLLLRNEVRSDEINAQGRTPLHESVRSGDLHIVKLLIKNGSPVNLKCTEGFTPLSLAVLHRKPGYILEELLAAGAVIDGLTDKYGVSILEQVLIQIRDFGLERCKLLLRRLYIENPNFHIKGLIERYKYCRELSKYVEECVLELKRMESVKVGYVLRLSDFIKRNCPQNVVSDLDILLRSISNNSFLIYFDVICNKISKFRLVKKLQQLYTVKHCFDDPRIRFKIECDYDCLLMIAKYLTNQDLVRLILAFYCIC